MQSNRQLLAIVPLILAAIVGGCVGVVTSPSPLAQTPRIGELPVTQTVSAQVQSPITLSNGDSINVLCPGGRVVSSRVSKTQVLVSCAGVIAPPTVTPTIAPIPPTITPTATRPPTLVPPTVTLTATRILTPVPPTRTPAPPTRTPTVPAPTTPVAGRTYYVGTAGSDAWPGTLSQPFKTIQHAVDLMAGGDTTYILGGTYNEPVRFFYKTNTTGQYMTLTNFPGATVVIDGTNVPFSYSQEGLVYISSTNYVRISGLSIKNANMAGIYVGYSDHIEIVKNQTYNTRTSGVGIWGGTNIVVDGNDIALACNGGGEEDLKINGASHVVVRNNHVHDGANPSNYGGEGLNISGGEASADGSHDIRVYNNTVNNLVKLGFGVEAWKNRLYDVEVFNNISYNNAWGFIVASEQGGSDEDVKIYNNIAYNNTNAGFAIPWWSGTADGLHKNIQFVNNTAYGNGTGFTVQSPRNEGVIFRNNILFGNRGAVSIIAGAQGQITLDHNLTTDPLFVNSAGADFHLQSGSPAIDAGASLDAPNVDFDNKARPRGAGYDIGAFEN